MTSTLTKPTNGAAPVVSSEWSDEEKKLIKSQIAPGASDNELRLFQAQCRRTGLDLIALCQRPSLPSRRPPTVTSDVPIEPTPLLPACQAGGLSSVLGR